MAGKDPVLAKDFASYRAIIHYALPLILSYSGGIIMQFTDRMFLAWHAPESVAGAGTAGMISICFISFFSVTTGFTSVFTSQYLGSQRLEKIGPVVWQGIYLSLVFGLVTYLIAFQSLPLFAWIGHEPAVMDAEVDYFSAIMQGGVFFMLTMACLGFFTGRGDNRKVMLIQFGAILVNICLDYAMIFGTWGFSPWGVSGAAWATVLAKIFAFIASFALFLRPPYRTIYHSWTAKLQPALAQRVLRFGMPSGVKSVVELLLWSIFLGLIGLLGSVELAASNVAFTINNVAWQPMIGVSMAVSMLVGKAQGAGRPDLSRLAMIRGFWITQAWEIAGGLLFILFPYFFLNLFFGNLPPEQAEPLLRTGRYLLMFVAVYCIIDSVNVVFAQGLIGAGDSWWTSKMTFILTACSIVALYTLYRLNFGLYAYWTVATLYIAASGVTWLWRFFGKEWESMQVIETVVVDD